MSAQGYPPPEATREQVLAWRNAQTKAHNDAVKASDAAVEEARESEGMCGGCGHAPREHDRAGCMRSGCGCKRTHTRVCSSCGTAGHRMGARACPNYDNRNRWIELRDQVPELDCARSKAS